MNIKHDSLTFAATKIVIGLGMLALGVWLIVASPTVQAKSDAGYLGMGEWRTVTTEPDNAC